MDFLQNLSGFYIFKREVKRLIRVARALDCLPTQTPTRSTLEHASTLQSIATSLYLPKEGDGAEEGEDQDEDWDEIEERFANKDESGGNDDDEVSIIYEYIPPDN